MTYLLLFISVLCSAVIDAIISDNTFARFGLWFSRDGWQCKHIFTEWLNKWLPLWLSKFIAEDVLCMFTDLSHLSKFIMIGCFCLCISFSTFGLLLWFGWSFAFNIVYWLVR